MGLKFGYRKLAISRAEWNARNTVFTKTAGGKFGPRKSGNLAPDPALAAPTSEVLPPPPLHDIGRLSAPAAIKVVREDSGIDSASLLGSELNRPGGMASRVSVLRELLTRAEGEKDGPLADLIGTEIEKLTRAPDEEA
jgi:hypothetical protein